MRKINEIIVHCSATYPDQKCTVDDIRKWHKERGFYDIGYHFVIYKDGTIINGRKLTLVGAHCSGHNARTIGICYVGGLDDKGYPTDTRTPEQKEALKSLINSLCNLYPITRITGHNQYSNKSCPCFNAENEYKSLINKFYIL